jgi:FixJ family two-component response regulator
MATEHIAIVDDDESLRRAMARLVKAHSYRVRTYASGQEFLDSLTTGSPCCLILDLQMGSEISGLDLLDILADRGLRIPIIIATAHDDPEARRRCDLAGVAAFLVKPFAAGSLVQTLKACTRRRTTSG